ncbi:MAG TPA: response regulator transcription factor [Chloroflexota bacterium]|nr:response regulator transcription factor [Chloroflexota bacterium]HUM67370.1 response regulator transcription factor [Chloroflexota bacterium]
MIGVLVVDDHAIVRRGVMEILNEAPDLTVVGEAGTGQEALQLARQRHFDVLVLDMSLPDMNGLEVLRQIRSLKPDVRTLILSIYPEEQYALRTLKAGALGYLTKESVPTELVTAVRQVARGSRYISQSLGELLVGEMMAEQPALPHTTLSDREYQVMILLGKGKTVGDIAADLSLSVKTVSTYRRRILEKLRLETTADIIRYALQHNLSD